MVGAPLVKCEPSSVSMVPRESPITPTWKGLFSQFFRQKKVQGKRFLPYVFAYIYPLDPTCNKYCDLIG